MKRKRFYLKIQAAGQFFTERFLEMSTDLKLYRSLYIIFIHSVYIYKRFGGKTQHKSFQENVEDDTTNKGIVLNI